MRHAPAAWRLAASRRACGGAAIRGIPSADRAALPASRPVWPQRRQRADFRPMPRSDRQTCCRIWSDAMMANDQSAAGNRRTEVVSPAPCRERSATARAEAGRERTASIAVLCEVRHHGVQFRPDLDQLRVDRGRGPARAPRPGPPSSCRSARSVAMWRSASGRAADTAAATTAKSCSARRSSSQRSSKLTWRLLRRGVAEDVGRQRADEEGVEDERDAAAR